MYPLLLERSFCAIGPTLEAEKLPDTCKSPDGDGTIPQRSQLIAKVLKSQQHRFPFGVFIFAMAFVQHVPSSSVNYDPDRAVEVLIRRTVVGCVGHQTLLGKEIPLSPLDHSSNSTLLCRHSGCLHFDVSQRGLPALALLLVPLLEIVLFSCLRGN